MRRLTMLAMIVLASALTVGGGELRGDAAGIDDRRRAAALLAEVRGVVAPGAPGGEMADRFLARHQFDIRRSAPLSYVPPGAHARALAQRQAFRSGGVPGSNGRWSPVGKGPLDMDNPAYPRAAHFGTMDSTGMVGDLAYDPDHDRVLAAVTYGGVWASDDRGRRWRSIGESLPTQLIGAVAYSPAGGGTILALTGESEFVLPFAGLGHGGFRSTNGGRTWSRSRGLPSETFGFELAVDPTRPSVVYAATGLGLYRSTDAGRTFHNVRLPTGDCAGRTAPGRCYLQNVVTDVVVQAPDRFGHRGGTVLAAVGWPWGDRPSRGGPPEATHNGLYRSESGGAGSFTRVDVGSGFAPADRIGRVNFSAADGPAQDHGYVYAIVQDPKLVHGHLPYDVPADPRPGSPTQFQGIYVTSDFGLSWTKMAGTEAVLSPTTGSTFSPSVFVSYPLGAQAAAGQAALYNMTIAVDPTRQTAYGVPTRLTFGLEEIFQNELTNQPQNGPTSFRVLAGYEGGSQCNFTAIPVCPFNRDTYRGSVPHADQHASLFVPEPGGGTTFLVGHDGGVDLQTVRAGEELRRSGWSTGVQHGLQTLLLYSAAIARDGIIYGGLQDSGAMRVERDGSQVALFGADGLDVAVDPNDSDRAYETTQFGGIHATTDGGKTWKSIRPQAQGVDFFSPFALDPTDPNHLLAAGRQVKESVYGPETNSAYGADLFYNPLIPEFPEDGHDPTSEKNWATVFDFGNAHGEHFTATAMAVRGNAAYVAGCAQCDPNDRAGPFSRALATNVGGQDPPRRMSRDGWHVAAARGLPRRFVTSVVIDPANPRTIYVTLSGYGTHVPRAVPGEDASGMAGGHVYVSHDAGNRFRDVSANLPDVGANWVLTRGRQLIVGTDVGVFISRSRAGGRWALLGDGLPAVPVMRLALQPGNPNVLVAATYGRGVYRYRFPG